MILCQILFYTCSGLAGNFDWHHGKDLFVIKQRLRYRFLFHRSRKCTSVSALSLLIDILLTLVEANVRWPVPTDNSPVSLIILVGWRQDLFGAKVQGSRRNPYCCDAENSILTQEGFGFSASRPTFLFNMCSRCKHAQFCI